MKKPHILVASLTIVAVLASTLATSAAVSARSAHRAPAAKAVHVGLVLDVGGVNDRSFNESAWNGAYLEAMKGKMGMKKIPGVVSTYLQTPVGGGQTDYVDELQHFASSKNPKYALIIAIGFAMENAIYQVAKKYPKERFGIVDGAPVDNKGNTVNLPNVVNLQFREEQSGYLVGVLAGLMEKNKVGAANTNKIGMVGGFPYPTVTGYMCGYIEGAKSVDPKVQVYSAFSNTFTDQGIAKNIGLSQIGKGASILFQVDGGAGLGYMAAAHDRSKYAIGVDQDQDYLGKYIITSAMKRVDTSVYLAIRSIVTGKFKGGDRWFSVNNNGAGYATDTHHIPSAYKAIANSDEKKIKAGKIKIYTKWHSGACTPTVG